MSLFVFFLKQKTAYEMRISDWSSDVCSSDLPSWYILLLEGGAPPASQCSTASRDRRDKARVRRTRGRIFYHAFGNAVGGERQDVRRLFARRSGRPGHLDRKSTRLNSSHSCAPRMPSPA